MRKLFLVICFLSVLLTNGQPGGGGDPGAGEPVPLQGMFILFAAGIFLAVKSLYNRKNNSEH